MSTRIIQVRPSRDARWKDQGGWEVFEAEGVCPVYCQENGQLLFAMPRGVRERENSSLNVKNLASR